MLNMVGEDKIIHKKVARSQRGRRAPSFHSVLGSNLATRIFDSSVRNISPMVHTLWLRNLRLSLVGRWSGQTSEIWRTAIDHRSGAAIGERVASDLVLTAEPDAVLAFGVVEEP